MPPKPKKVDEYRQAKKPRMLDVHALMRQERRLAAWHMGGIAVECLIKLGIVHARSITHWDAVTIGMPSLKNPGHLLPMAIGFLPTPIQVALRADPTFAPNLAIIQQPLTPTGSSGVNYIDLRYHAHDPTDADHAKWKTAYQSVVRSLTRVFNAHLTPGWR